MKLLKARCGGSEIQLCYTGIQGRHDGRIVSSIEVLDGRDEDHGFRPQNEGIGLFQGMSREEIRGMDVLTLRRWYILLLYNIYVYIRFIK